MKHLVAIFTMLYRKISLSLRWQMVVWYTAAFTVLLVLTGAVFYQYLEHSLEAGVDTDLQLRAQQIAAGAVISHGTVSLHNVTGDLPGFGTPPSSSPIQSVDVNAGALVRLLDAQGHLIAQTPAFRTLSVPAESITQPQAGTPWQGTIKTRHHEEIRIDSRALRVAGKTIALIQVGESLENLHTLLHQLVAALLVVGTLVLACCAAVSYWLAGYSFAPIQRLAQTARKIKAGDLKSRVPVPPIRDEVQYLALTLNEMLESLEQAFARQRRFVADASHELRTPVAVIRNTAGVALLEPPQLDETVVALSEIRTETERLTLLLTDLLTLARGDEGQTRFEQETVQFDQLVETVAATLDQLAAERDIQLEVQIPHEVALLGDEARLIQVVMNLLDNAIRYTNPGGQVCVSVKQTASEACLIVRDTGIGIAPEHLPHIFERFYRADPMRRETGGSNSGLGLSIVEWIIHAHGGSVVVNSQVGQGTCFTVRLPLVLST
ncbi:two-component sensor histidine kinase [Reticulibacter mediterranei]|uniref:histidine kinase n=1 Tax=Reticulibacter mediterranei TaxID=2778369 RepID=A0A8J3N8B2_9CHLR|nr:ATP-binding protein [Reticulibacter mediterranei]GHO99355.1 two-component sensor histidine kinase [Reticulibacter mediterranei]